MQYNYHIHCNNMAVARVMLSKKVKREKKKNLVANQGLWFLQEA